MNLMLDITLAVLFLATVLIYMLRGLVDSIWGALSALVSFILAYIFGKDAGKILFNWGFIDSDGLLNDKTQRLLANILGYVAVFVISIIIMSIAGFLIKYWCNSKSLKAVNHALGALLGIVAGVIYVWIICIAISFLVEKQLAGDATETIRKIAEESFVFKFFCKISPLEYININETLEKIKGLTLH